MVTYRNQFIATWFWVPFEHVTIKCLYTMTTENATVGGARLVRALPFTVLALAEKQKAIITTGNSKILPYSVREMVFFCTSGA